MIQECVDFQENIYLWLKIFEFTVHFKFIFLSSTRTRFNLSFTTEESNLNLKKIKL